MPKTCSFLQSLNILNHKRITISRILIKHATKRKNKKGQFCCNHYQSWNNAFSIVISQGNKIFESTRENFPELLHKLITLTLAVLKNVVSKVQERHFLSNLCTVKLFLPCRNNQLSFTTMDYTPLWQSLSQKQRVKDQTIRIAIYKANTYHQTARD